MERWPGEPRIALSSPRLVRPLREARESARLCALLSRLERHQYLSGTHRPVTGFPRKAARMSDSVHHVVLVGTGFGGLELPIGFAVLRCESPTSTVAIIICSSHYPFRWRLIPAYSEEAGHFSDGSLVSLMFGLGFDSGQACAVSDALSERCFRMLSPVRSMRQAVPNSIGQSWVCNDLKHVTRLVNIVFPVPSHRKRAGRFWRVVRGSGYNVRRLSRGQVLQTAVERGDRQ